MLLTALPHLFGTMPCLTWRQYIFVLAGDSVIPWELTSMQQWPSEDTPRQANLESLEENSLQNQEEKASMAVSKID